MQPARPLPLEPLITPDTLDPACESKMLFGSSFDLAMSGEAGEYAESYPFIKVTLYFIVVASCLVVCELMVVDSSKLDQTARLLVLWNISENSVILQKIHSHHNDRNRNVLIYIV